MSHTRPLALALALALALVACDQPEDDPDQAAPPPEADDTTDEPTTLRLLTHDSFDVSEEVLDAFEDETGIEVEVIPSGDAGTVVNQAILTMDAPQGDVLFGIDNTFLTRAFEHDLFVPYESPALGDVDPSVILDEEHRITPIDRGDVCLNYDRQWFEQEGLAVPDDLADLTDDAYEGLLVVTNPATSSPGLAFLLATVERFGEDGWLDYWQELRDNDVLVTDGWSEAYYDAFTTGEGDRPLVLSYASSPPVDVFFAEQEVDEAPTGVIEASCFEQIEFAGILRGTEHEQEAGQLIDFMLSEPFQEDIPLTMFVFPVNEQADLPQVFVDHAVLPDEPLRLDPETIGEHREDWIEAWTDTVLR